MAKLFLSLFAVAMILTTGCVSRNEDRFVTRSDKFEEITLRAAGQQGQAFHLELNIDGQPRIWTGVTPKEIPLKARVLAGVSLPPPGSKGVVFEIVTTNSFVSASAPDSSRAWRFRYHASGIEVWQ